MNTLLLGKSTRYSTDYVKICNDFIAGLLLSVIIDLFLENENIYIYKDEPCIVRERSSWHNECGISTKQYDRAIKILIEKGFVTTEVHCSPFFPTQQKKSTFIFLNNEEIEKALPKVEGNISQDEAVYD